MDRFDRYRNTSGESRHRGGAILLLAVIVLAAGRPLHAAEKDTRLAWQLLEQIMPIPVFLAGGTRIDHTAVITGGITQSGVTSDQVQIFDLNTLKWSNPIKLKTARCWHAQVTLDDGRVLVAGGQTGTAPNGLKAIGSCELIDAKNRTVTEVAALLRPTDQPTAHVLAAGLVVIVGGKHASILDTTRLRWFRHIPLRQSRSAHCSVLLPEGEILVIGGLNRRSLELVDPARGVSRMLSAQLPHVIDDLRAVVLPDGRVWILGGQHSQTGQTTDATWLVSLEDPRHTTIEPGPMLEIDDGVADHSLANVGRWTVLVGGESQQNGDDTELKTAKLLDRQTLKITALPSTHWPHDDAVIVTDDHDIFVFGGFATAQQFNLPLAVGVIERLRLTNDAALAVILADKLIDGNLVDRLRDRPYAK